MRIDVMGAKDKPLLEVYPELQRLKSWSEYKGAIKEKAFRYIILLYSKDSILNDRVPEPLDVRKVKAADLAGFKRNPDGQHGKTVRNQLFNLKDSKIVEMVTEYMIYQDNLTWSEIIAAEQSYWEYFKIRMKSVDAEKDADIIKASKDKETLRMHAKEIKKDLEKLYKEFYSDHTDVQEANKQGEINLQTYAKDKKFRNAS